MAGAQWPTATIAWLELICGTMVAGFAVVCLWCYSKCSIDLNRYAEIVQTLKKRRG